MTYKHNLSKLIIYFLIFYILFSNKAQSQIVNDSIYSKSIKTIILQRNGVELSMPAIRLGTSDKLLLRFDELSENANYYSYRIQHCTHDWKISDISVSEYINGFETSSIGNYKFSFNTLQPYVNYWETIPNDMSEITASGNYLLTVFLDDNPDSIIFTQRFYVYEQLPTIKSEIGQVLGAEGLKQNQNISVVVSPQKGSYFSNPQLFTHLYITQNGRKDLYRELPIYNVSGNDIYYKWKDENVFPGGNEFRYFDISNIYFPMYTTEKVESFGGENFAYLKPEDNRSRKNYVYTENLNGQFKISAANKTDMNTEADYVWVDFTLPMRYPRMDGLFYIVGNFCNWNFNDENMLSWNSELNCYKSRIYVKQGYYSYLIIFVPFGEKEGLTSVVEGNFFETRNDYYVFMYQHYPSDRYDRLIGIATLQKE